MSKLMVIIISILFVLLSGCSDVSTITITQTVTPTSVAETPKPTVTNSTTSPDYFKLSLNDLGETYKGDGYTISYPSNWFLSTISPTEIRLIPPNNSSGGLIAIRATHDGIRVLGASAYYSDSAFCLLLFPTYFLN